MDGPYRITKRHFSGTNGAFWDEDSSILRAFFIESSSVYGLDLKEPAAPAIVAGVVDSLIRGYFDPRGSLLIPSGVMTY